MLPEIHLANWQITLICMLIYFVLEFKTRSEKGIPFSVLYWIKDNKFNLILYFLIGIVWYAVNPNITPGVAVSIGLAPNLLIDWIDTMRYQKKLKATQ